MELFHKSVNKRVDVFLYGMEKVWAENFAFNEEILNYVMENQVNILKYAKFSEDVANIEKDPYVFELTKNTLTVQSHNLLKLLEKVMPAYQDMVYKSKPMIDETMGYLEKVTKAVQKLSDNRNSVEYSERIMIKFDKALAKYQKNNAVIRKRIDVVKAGFAEVEKYYQTLKND